MNSSSHRLWLCDCGAEFTHRQSLSRHKRTCQEQQRVSDSESLDYQLEEHKEDQADTLAEVELFEMLEPPSPASADSDETIQSFEAEEENAVEGAGDQFIVANDTESFAPFPNMEVAMFCLLMQSGSVITKRTGQRILDLLHIPNFNPANLPKSFATLQKYLDGVSRVTTYTLTLTQTIPATVRRQRHQTLQEFKAQTQPPRTQQIQVTCICIHSIIRRECAKRSFRLTHMLVLVILLLFVKLVELMELVNFVDLVDLVEL